MGRRGKRAGLTAYVPPIARDAMDGAPERLWLIKKDKQRQSKKQILRFAKDDKDWREEDAGIKAVGVRSAQVGVACGRE